MMCAYPILAKVSDLIINPLLEFLLYLTTRLQSLLNLLLSRIVFPRRFILLL